MIRRVGTLGLFLGIVIIDALLHPEAALGESIPGIPDAFLGPYALLVAALVAVIYLARMLQTFITDLRAQRDLALLGWREQTTATNAVAAAVEARNRSEEARLQIERAVQAADDANAKSNAETAPRRRRPASPTGRTS